jgi:predicted Zn-dependent protease
MNAQRLGIMICALSFVVGGLRGRCVLAFDLGDVDMQKVVSGGAKLTKAAGGISDEEEEQIGREVAANLAARYGLLDNAAKLQYVNEVGQALVRHCDRKRIPYHFAILHTSEINALAAPGGYIFITQGLLESLNDESELAGVLAHEVTHVVRQHVVKAIREANVVEGGQDLASSTGQDTSPYAPLSDFSITLLSKGLSRSDELEADKLGTILAAKVGYDAYGLRRSIESLAAKQQADLFLAHFNKTHPPAADRLQTIDQAIKENHLSADGLKLHDRFTRRLSLLIR